MQDLICVAILFSLRGLECTMFDFIEELCLGLVIYILYVSFLKRWIPMIYWF